MDPIYVINQDDISARILDGEVVVIHMITTHYYSLNASGALIWQLLSERPRSLNEIVSELAAVYALTPAAVEGDVKALLSDLVEEQLVMQK